MIKQKMKSALFRINPLIKISFIFFELGCIYFFQSKAITIFVLTTLVLCFISEIKLLGKTVSTLLNISPLLLSILILGFLFGNDYQSDLRIIFQIIILVCFSVILINTTSPYDLLQSLKTFCPENLSENLIIFFYGLIFFFNVLIVQFKNTITAYKIQKSKTPAFTELPGMFSSYIEKTLQNVHVLSFKSTKLLQGRFAKKLSIIDSIPIILILFQIGFILR